MKGEIDIIWEAIRSGKNALPWSVHGINAVAASTTSTNPTPLYAKLLGELSYLPFVVPAGHVLAILDMHLSLETAATRESHLKILASGNGYTNIIIRDLVTYIDPAHEEHYACVWIPEGYTVRIDLENGSTGSVTFSWLVSGVLVNVREPG